MDDFVKTKSLLDQAMQELETKDHVCQNLQNALSSAHEKIFYLQKELVEV